MTLLRLFYEFFKVGLFSIGGGMATIPFLYDISDKTGWFTHAQLADMIAVSESTPGPIGINMATYCGFETGGIPGCLIATFGLVLPSFLVIILIVSVLKKYYEKPLFKSMLSGIRPASIALIAAAGVTVAKTSLFTEDLFSATGRFIDLFSIESIILAVITFVLMQKIKIHPFFYIVLGAVVGIVFKFAG